jgi:hypothetical protein
VAGESRASFPTPARDLLAFAEALRHGRFVRPATAERLWSAKPELGSPEYGFGFGVGRDALGRSTGHSGGFTGIASVLDIHTRWHVGACARRSSEGAKVGPAPPP